MRASDDERVLEWRQELLIGAMGDVVGHVLDEDPALSGESEEDVLEDRVEFVRRLGRDLVVVARRAAVGTEVVVGGEGLEEDLVVPPFAHHAFEGGRDRSRGAPQGHQTWHVGLLVADRRP